MEDFRAGLLGPNAAKHAGVVTRNAIEHALIQPLPMEEKIVLRSEQQKKIKNVTVIHVLWTADSPIGLLGQNAANHVVEALKPEVVHVPIQLLPMGEKIVPRLDLQMEHRNATAMHVPLMEVCQAGPFGQNAARHVEVALKPEVALVPIQPLPMEARTVLNLDR